MNYLPYDEKTDGHKYSRHQFPYAIYNARSGGFVSGLPSTFKL